MRILTLTKRQYMKHDLLDDLYGRFREIPLALARRGHDVQGLCLSYQAREIQHLVDVDAETGASVTWRSVNLRRTVISSVAEFVRQGRLSVRDFEPHVIWAGSDSLYGPLALHIAKGSESRVVIDIYDDFESFSLARIPGVAAVYRRSCREADGVTSFGDAMTNYVEGEYGRRGPTLTLVNGTNKQLFRPLDKAECRESLRLPLSGKLVGFAGAIQRRLGIEAVLEAFEVIAESEPDVHLVIAGHRDRNVAIPSRPWIHYMGVLDHHVVPVLLNALDVGVVLQRLGRAGRFGYPYKAHEMLACGLPIVAADIGAMRELLDDCPACRFDPNRSDEIRKAVIHQLREPHVTSTVVPDWDSLAKDLEVFLLGLI